jgi:hypothetical protein
MSLAQTPGLFHTKKESSSRPSPTKAVIAIENTRLFEAEQASKRKLTEALEQLTATARSDVL